MYRNFGIGLLIASFSLSSVDAARASQIVEVQPVIVQPYEIQQLNDQVLNRDRQNRDEEIAIKQLIEENNKLTQDTLARQQDEGLAKVNQTMLSYSNALVSRDRARIIANGEKGWSSRYGDLIALTEDADDMTVHQDLVNKSDMLAQKFVLLNDLKDEMTTLNDKLNGQGVDAINQKDSIIEGYKKVSQQQQDKIQMLITRLDELDRKIAHFDEILAQKDEQIVRLKDDLAATRNEAAAKDETINEQRNQIAILQRSSTGLPSSSTGTGNLELSPIIVNPSNNHQESTPVFNQPLAYQLAQLKNEIASKDQIIKQQQDQIISLQKRFVMMASNKDQGSQLALQLSQKSGQVDLLKSELENKITQENNRNQELSAKDQVIKQQEDQLAILKSQSRELSSKEEIIRSLANRLARVSGQFKGQNSGYAKLQEEIMGLRNRLHNQALDLKIKTESIRWLNQVLAAAKNKAEYYKLTSQQQQLSMKQVQEEMQAIKEDFARRFKDYDQFENAIQSFKSQVSRLGLMLSQKQTQVEFLNSELRDKTTQENYRHQQEAQLEQDLKAQLQDKDDQIVKMKSDIQAILQTQANKEIYHRHALAQVDDRINLARELIGLQQEEASLLDEKSILALKEFTFLDGHVAAFEHKIKILLARHRIQAIDLRGQIGELKNELGQKNQEIDSLKEQLEERITHQRNQAQLLVLIQDLKSQVQGNEDRITEMKKQIESGQGTSEEVDSLKQQLASLQDKADQTQQQLDSKTAQYNQVSAMMQDYQKKLESKDSAYNEQLGQKIASQNYQAQLEKQVTHLSEQLQDKEAEVIKIKKDMNDLQEWTNAKDRDAQARDLSLSMVQQKMLDRKINEYQGKINGLQAASGNQTQEIISLKTELALARQELKGMPSSDEIEFLRTGLKKATEELKKKDALYSQIKANADEYEKEFKEQSREFESLKEQLQNAYDDIDHKNEDLKYKNLEVIRLKELSVVKNGDLQDQVKVLTRKLEAAGNKQIGEPQGANAEALQEQVMILTKRLEAIEKKPMGKIHGNKVEALQEQLKAADLQIKDLQTQLNLMKPPSDNSPMELKLKQALDKIDEQGRIINVLVQKLQAAGQSVDLTRQ